MQKTTKSFALVFLTFFLLFSGLLTGGIGETFCRYILTTQQDLVFEVKGTGTYYISSDETWTKNEENGQSHLFFEVSNVKEKTDYPVTSHLFHVRWFASSKGDYSLVVIYPSGREITYQGIAIKESALYTEYRFMDENKEEVMLNLEGNQASVQMLGIAATEVEDHLFAKTVVVDAAYDLETSSSYSCLDVEPFTLSSNYLKENEEVTYLVQDEIEITMLSNQDVSSRVQIDLSDESLLAEYSLSNSEIALKKNQTASFLLSLSRKEEIVEEIIEEQTMETTLIESTEPEKILDSSASPETTDSPLESDDTTQELETSTTPESTDETTQEPESTPESEIKKEPLFAIVKWQILNEENEITNELKATFVLQEKIGMIEIPTVSIQAENTVFSKLVPLELNLMSDEDTLVELKDPLFPQFTKYSIDEGETWTVLAEEQSIVIECTANENVHLILDYFDVRQLSDQIFTLNAYVNETIVSQIELNQTSEALTFYELSEINSGIINNQEISFNLNDVTPQISVQMKKYGIYEYIQLDSYFNLNQQENTVTLNLKEGSTIAEGVYRLHLEQYYEQQVVKENFIPFYVIEQSGGSES